MIKKALEILHDYCYQNEHCDTCIFNDCRDDLDVCKVNQLVDDDRYMRAPDGQWEKWREDYNNSHAYYGKCPTCKGKVMFDTRKPFKYCPYCGEPKKEVE